MGTLTGTIEKQDTTAFNSASLLGDYGFLLNGSAFSYVNQSQMMSSYAGAGVMTLNADGSVSGAATWDDGADRNWGCYAKPTRAEQTLSNFEQTLD
jgi:hypothetical protein